MSPLLLNELPPRIHRAYDLKRVNSLPFCERGAFTLKLDMVSPPPRKGPPRPVVITLHGGNWRSGSRQSLRPVLMDLAGRGFVAMSIDYRVQRSGEGKSNSIPPELLVDDLRCAIQFVKDNAFEYGLDSNRIALVGYGAGAHGVLMAGLTNPASVEGQPHPENPIKAIVAFGAITDMTLQFNLRARQGKSLLADLLGTTPEQNPELYQQLSPVHLLDAQDPPTLVIYADKDESVFLENGQNFDAVAKEVGAPVELLVAENTRNLNIGARHHQVQKQVYKFLATWMDPNESIPKPPSAGTPAPTPAPTNPVVPPPAPAP